VVSFFIRRPVFAGSIAIIMALAGLISLALLPIAQFPEIAPPQVVVRAAYPGASSEVVANSVTTPLEQQINGVPGMAYMSSISANDGTSTIIVTFDVGYSLETAAVDVQNRVSQASPRLPGIVNQGGITVQKQNNNFTLAVNVYSPDDSVDLITLSNFAYLQMADNLKRVPGVGDVQIFGERRYAMRVWLDPDRLAQMGITAVDVQQAIAEQNVQVAAGKIGQAPAPEGTEFELQVNALGRLTTPEQFGDIIVRMSGPNNSTVRLRDVARIELGAQQYSSSATINGKPTVFVAIFQLPGSNALSMDQAVRQAVDEMRKTFPKGIEAGIVYDTTMFVSASMFEVAETLIIAVILVILVVYLFLQNWRATLIPGIAIPVSLLFTCVLMLAFGFSLNTVSMLGMVLAIGLVVDDAIVVVENIERQLEEGKEPMEAAIIAMREVTGPIIATTAVLLAVFIPVAFLPGVTGRIYNQFALTVAISVAISAFNSLTLSPALGAVLLRKREPKTTGFFGKFNAGFGWLSANYSSSIRGLIGARRIALALFAIGLVATYALYKKVPTTFLPVEDQGYFFTVMQLPDGASLERTEAVAEKARHILAAEDGVQDAISVVGFNFLTGASQSNAAAQFAVLKPWAERERSATDIVNAVRFKLLSIPEALVLSFDPPSIPGISTTGGFEFQVEDRAGRGSRALDAATQALMMEARKQPELNPQALFSTFSTSTPQYDYDLDRTRAKLLGLNLPDVFSTMQIYLGSLYVNDFNLFGRTFRVTLQADKGARAEATDLSRLYVRNNSGGMVPLDTLGKLVPTVGPEFVSHYNIYPSALINGAPAPGYSSSQAIAAMQRAAAAALPPGFGYEWTGITYQELRAGDVSGIIFALAIVFVFLFLAAQYESWSMPFMVILGVPIAMFGAVGMLWLRGIQIDVFSQVGFVMLIGLAAKNAILIVEFAKHLREQGRSIVDAAMEAGRLRLRPILMTAFAFILGVVPLTIASGAGAASRQSIGNTVFGGMLISTAVGLLLVPVFYAVIERLRERNAPDDTQGAERDTAPAE
jgi:HAE1 family hydrophobic/amphiphilic exporter-1